MAGPAEAFVLAPGEGRSIDLGAFGMTVKASWDETDGVFSLLEVEEPPEFGLAIRRGEVDDSLLAAVARRQSMEIVGPLRRAIRDVSPLGVHAVVLNEAEAVETEFAEREAAVCLFARDS